MGQNFDWFPDQNKSKGNNLEKKEHKQTTMVHFCFEGKIMKLWSVHFHIFALFYIYRLLKEVREECGVEETSSEEEEYTS